MIMTLLFNACAQLKTREALKTLNTAYRKMPVSYSCNEYILASLIDALMKCGDVESAEDIFNRSTVKNQAVYGAMMKGKLRG